MSRLLRRLAVVAAILGVAVLAAHLGAQAFARTRGREWLQRVVGDAIGGTCTIAGPVSLSLWPRPEVLVAQVSVRSVDGITLAAGTAQVRPRLLAMIVGTAQLASVRLQDVTIVVPATAPAPPRGSARPAAAPPAAPVPTAGRRFSASHFTLERGTLRLEQPGGALVVEGLRLDADGFSVTVPASRVAHVRPTPELSLRGHLEADVVRHEPALGWQITSVAADVASSEGSLRLDPLQFAVVGAIAKARLVADHATAQGQWRFSAQLDRLPLEDAARALALPPLLSGEADASLELSGRGQPFEGWPGRVDGRLSLDGAALRLQGGTLDGELDAHRARVVLRRAGAALLSPAEPRGLDALAGEALADRSTYLVQLSSRWKIAQGVAIADDAALTTSARRIALQARVDIAQQRLLDGTAAIVDRRGCLQVGQRLDDVNTPPILGRGAVALCNPFYAGKVPPP